MVTASQLHSKSARGCNYWGSVHRFSVITSLYQVCFILPLTCFDKILTRTRVDRSQRCYSNCSRSGTRSIHLVYISATSSSLGTPLSLPASSKTEHACGCASPQARPLQGDGLRTIFFFYFAFVLHLSCQCLLSREAF